MIKLKKEKRRWLVVPRAREWEESRPFVINKQGVLTHRPMTVKSYRHISGGGGYLVVQNYCGNSSSGGDDWYGSGKYTFLNAPEEDAIVCQRCEEAAIAEGLPASHELAGRHVHVGGVKAVRACCEDLV